MDKAIIVWVYEALIAEAAAEVQRMAEYWTVSYAKDRQYDHAIDAIIDAARTWDGRGNWIGYALSCVGRRRKNAYRRNGKSVEARPFTYGKTETGEPVMLNEPHTTPDKLQPDLIEAIRADPELLALPILRVYYGHSNREIAECFGVSERTIESRFQRAREKFSEFVAA